MYYAFLKAVDKKS